jgi:hypothetical protein
MDRSRASAIAQIESALRATLDDIDERVRNGAGRSTVSELVRHARELANLLDQVVGRLEPDEDSERTRRAAGDLVAHVRAVEADLASRAPQ